MLVITIIFSIIIVSSVLFLIYAIRLNLNKSEKIERGASSFNGIGTSYYGKKDFNYSDGSYIATKWLIFLFFQSSHLQLIG